MKTQAQRAAKRHKRENRDSKESTWYCAAMGALRAKQEADTFSSANPTGKMTHVGGIPVGSLKNVIQKGSNS